MDVYLMYQNTAVCTMQVQPGLSGMLVKKAETLDRDKMPFRIPDGCGEENLCVLLAQWFAQRRIPNTRPNLDTAMCQLFQLPRHKFGRMFGYQDLAAFLAHYMSMEDDYFITPKTPQAVCCAYEEPYFPNLYIWNPVTYSDLLALKDNPDTVSGRILCGSRETTWEISGLDFTIRTGEPMRWTKARGKAVLTNAAEKSGKETSVVM